MRPANQSSLELLETRIAPAAVATYHFTDRDGDDVTIKLTSAKGTSSALQSALDATMNAPGTFLLVNSGLQLQALSLSSPVFEGVNISILAKRSATLGGDGLVAVGEISGGSRAFGNVVVDGDLGRIGTDHAPGTMALKSLTVQSIALNSEESGGLTFTSITGNTGKVVIKGDVSGGLVFFDGNVASITVGGSVVGKAVAQGGSINVSGSVGFVKIGGDILAGTGNLTGRLRVGGNVGSVSIGGSIYGPIDNDDDSNSQIQLGGNVTKLLLKGDLIGRNGGFLNGFGQIGIAGNITTLDLRGSVLGSSGADSGTIQLAAGAGLIKIGGDIVGDDRAGSGSLTFTTATTVLVGGDLVGGNGTSSGTVNVGAGLTPSITIKGDIIGGELSLQSGGIAGGNDTTIGKLIVGGSLRSRGNLSSQGFIQSDVINTLQIRGDIVASTEAGSTTEQIEISGTIGTLAIGGAILGNAENTVRIVADSVNTFTVGRNAVFAEVGLTDLGAQVALVSVKGSWIASRLSVAVDDGADNIFGTTDDPALLASGTSRIASIIIGGQVTGTTNDGDSFVIRAHTIGSVSVAGNKYPFGAGPQSFGLGITPDVTIRDLM